MKDFEQIIDDFKNLSIQSSAHDILPSDIQQLILSHIFNDMEFDTLKKAKEVSTVWYENVRVLSLKLLRTYFPYLVLSAPQYFNKEGFALIFTNDNLPLKGYIYLKNIQNNKMRYSVFLPNNYLIRGIINTSKPILEAIIHSIISPNSEINALLEKIKTEILNKHTINPNNPLKLLHLECVKYKDFFKNTFSEINMGLALSSLSGNNKNTITILDIKAQEWLYALSLANGYFILNTLSTEASSSNIINKAFYLATLNDNSHILEALLQNYSNEITAETKGKSLILASQVCHFSTLQFLIQATGNDICIGFIEQALIKSVALNREYILQILLTNFCDKINQVGFLKTHLCIEAMTQGHHAIFTCLLKNMNDSELFESLPDGPLHFEHPNHIEIILFHGIPIFGEMFPSSCELILFKSLKQDIFFMQQILRIAHFHISNYAKIKMLNRAIENGLCAAILVLIENIGKGLSAQAKGMALRLAVSKGDQQTVTLLLNERQGQTCYIPDLKEMRILAFKKGHFDISNAINTHLKKISKDKQLSDDFHFEFNPSFTPHFLGFNPSPEQTLADKENNAPVQILNPNRKNVVAKRNLHNKK